MKAIAKALLAAAIATVGALATAAVDGGISLAEGLSAAAAGLIALGAVWGVPNAPATTKDQGADDAA